MWFCTVYCTHTHNGRTRRAEGGDQRESKEINYIKLNIEIEFYRNCGEHKNISNYTRSAILSTVTCSHRKESLRIQFKAIKHVKFPPPLFPFLTISISCYISTFLSLSCMSLESWQQLLNSREYMKVNDDHYKESKYNFSSVNSLAFPPILS